MGRIKVTLVNNGQQSEPVATAKPNGNKQIAEIQAHVETWKAWQESCKTMSLAEILKQNGIEMVASPKGFPSISINPTSELGIEFCDEEFAAINAAMGFYKYEVLEYHEHIAWFNHAVKCEDVRATYETWRDSRGQIVGQWKFWNWELGSYVPSDLEKDLTKRDGDPERLAAWKAWKRGKRFNMIRKHSAIDQMKSAQVFGTKFLAVFNTKKKEEHFNLVIGKYLESPYIEALEAEDERWADAVYAQKARTGLPEGYESTAKRSPEQLKIVDDIEAAGTTQIVTIKVQGKKSDWVCLFDPSAPNAKDLLQMWRMMPVTQVITAVEKVA